MDGSGRPMRAKARPLAPGGVPVASLRSGTYDHLSLYGSIKTFNGEKYKTFSHQNILFPTGKTFAKESSTGFSHMENVHEWEKKCLRTFRRRGRRRRAAVARQRRPPGWERSCCSK